MRIYILALLTILSVQARAATTELNLFYFSDAMTYDSDSYSYNRTFWDINFGVDLNKKGTLVLGWNYGSLSFTDNPGTATKLTVTDMGPKLTYFFDKNLTWPISFTYNIISRGKYTSGAIEAEERGTSMKVEVGYTPQISESWYAGAKLNYYKVSFNEEIVGDTALSQVTNGRTVIYPSFTLLYRWN